MASFNFTLSITKTESDMQIRFHPTSEQDRAVMRTLPLEGADLLTWALAQILVREESTLCAGIMLTEKSELLAQLTTDEGAKNFEDLLRQALKPMLESHVSLAIDAQVPNLIADMRSRLRG